MRFERLQAEEARSGLTYVPCPPRGSRVFERLGPECESAVGMQFRIADTFTDSLARLTGDEQGTATSSPRAASRAAAPRIR